MVRVKAPGGRLCEIPDTQLEAAMAEGAKFVSDYELSGLHQRTSMAVRFFEAEQKRKRPRSFRLKRRLRRG